MHYINEWKSYGIELFEKIKRKKIKKKQEKIKKNDFGINDTEKLWNGHEYEPEFIISVID